MSEAQVQREDSTPDRPPSDSRPERSRLSAAAFPEEERDLAPAGVAPTHLPALEIAETTWLQDYPRNEMAALCRNCGQVIRFRTHRLIAEHGRKERISDVLALKSIACQDGTRGGCELALMIEPA